VKPLHIITGIADGGLRGKKGERQAIFKGTAAQKKKSKPPPPPPQNPENLGGGSVIWKKERRSLVKPLFWGKKRRGRGRVYRKEWGDSSTKEKENRLDLKREESERLYA